MSVAGAIADAVAAAVTALALPGATVVRRKKPSLPQAAGDLPQVVVSVGEEGDAEPLWAGSVVVKYPVSVCVFTAGGRLTGDDSTLRDWRERIRKAIGADATYAGVPEFNTVDWSGRSPFAAPADLKDVNASLVTCTVEAIEARN